MIKRILAAAVLAVAATSASATTVTRDYSDAWNTTNESGWGLGVVQQGSIIFATLYVEGQDSAPIWYVGSNLVHQGGGIFSGELFRITGSYFGGPFNQGNTVATQVGTMVFTGTGVNSATLTYSVNGVVVNKTLSRLSFRTENIAGQYVGATVGAFSGCGSGHGAFESNASYTITQTESGAATIFEFGSNYTCTYQGSYVQTGRYGTLTGTGQCSNQQGVQQTFNATELLVSPEGLTARLDSGVGICRFNGRFGGVRR
jgi:hypothetical protein